MNYYEIIAVIAQLLAALMLMRSCFFLLKARKHISSTSYYALLSVILIGLFLATYNIGDPKYVLERFPWNTVFTIGSAYAFYFLAKSKQESVYKHFNYTNIMENNKNNEPIIEIAGIAIGIISLLKPSKYRREKRNFKLAVSVYETLLEICEDDGNIDEEELKILNEVKKSIAKRAIELGTP